MSWQRIIPRLLPDKISLLLFLFVTHWIVIFELYQVIPYIYHETNGSYWIHVVIGLFFYFNFAFNFVKVLTVETSGADIVYPSVLKPGWKFCSGCERNAPPRSFHCWSCQRCILRRDHHCVFTGNCIGHNNQRYFIGMLLYMCVGGLYCNFLNMDYSWEMLGGFNWRSALSMVLPLVAWVFGLNPGMSFIIATTCAICIFGCFTAITYLVFYATNISHGQTMYERANNIKEYNLGWRKNFVESFGPNWILFFLAPFLAENLPGNGVEFPKGHRFQDVKTF